MKKILLGIFVVTCFARICFGQTDYFPVGPWAIAYTLDIPSVESDWDGERQKLMDLGVTYIEGWTEPHDSLWLKNVCEPSGGQIKISTSMIPGRSKSFVDYIGNAPGSWANNGSLPPNYTAILDSCLDTLAKTYAKKQSWTSMFLSHETKSEWVDSNWTAYYTATNYAAGKWKNLIAQYGLPAYLADRTINIMPIKYLGGYTSMKEYAGSLSSLGIVENDCYELRHYTPVCYVLNSVAFDSFQTALDIFIQSADSCFEYFENPISKGSGNTKWHSVFQCGKWDHQQFIGGQWVWVPSTRWPTKEEIRVQSWLALSRGAKGIKYYPYFSSPPNLSASNYSEKNWGLVDEKRVPRDSVYNQLHPESPPIYDWVKEVNATVNTLAPVLANLTGQYAFGVNTRYGLPSIPVDFYIDSVNALDQNYRQYNYFEVGGFKDLKGSDYFILVNRYCQPEDTVEVSVKINYTPLYTGNYFIVDALNNETLTEILPRSVDTSFTVKLLPGGGRLLKIIPFASDLKVNNGAQYTNFRFVQVKTGVSTPLTKDSIEITQKYWRSGINQDSLMMTDDVGYWETKTTGWLPYVDSLTEYLELSQNNKNNIFEVRYKLDGKINTQTFVEDITFNDVPPGYGTIVINNGDEFTNKQAVKVKISGNDLFPGLYSMRYAEKPFNNSDGYVNFINNGTFADTTDWILSNAVFQNGYLHLLGTKHSPAPWQDSSVARQIITADKFRRWAGIQFLLSDDVCCYDAIGVYKTVEVFYGDTLLPRNSILMQKDIYLGLNNNTWTKVLLSIDTMRILDRLEIVYRIPEIEVPPFPPGGGEVNMSSVPNPLVIDNIRFEPSHLYGWTPVDTSGYKGITLSSGDGNKIIYLQLKDSCENIDCTPGWTDDIILDMTLPLVNISSPVSNGYINGTVSVYGSASDLHFDQWILEYRPFLSSEWQFLTGSDINHIDISSTELLYSWNTSQLGYGAHLLRLTASDKAGNVKADTHYVYFVDVPTLPPAAITADFALFNSLPVDGTVDGEGNIYATDTQADKIWKFSPEGDSLLCFGYKYTCTDTLGFNHPKGIAVDEWGNIWVTDCYQSKIKKYDGQGNYISTIGKHGNKAGEFNQPTGIAVNFVYIYVADHLNNRVQVFDRNGSFIRQFGDKILKQPAGIAIRQDGESCLIYVSDSKNNRIAIFDTLGNMVDSLGAGLDLREPWDICFDYNNNLYIADVYNNRVVQLDAWGNKLLTFGTQGKEAGEFKLPQGLAVSPDGKYVYVIDTHNDRIQRFKMYFDLGINDGPQLAGRLISPVLPVSFMLGQSYPNPSAFDATINYALPKEAKVKLNIYNTLGQKVRSLVNESQMPGYYSVNWDSKDDTGKRAAAGVYFYRLEAGEHSAHKKMVLIK